MKERIKRLMESQHLSQKAFAQFTGISEGTLSGVLNDRTRPTLQIVEAIHNHFPNVSLEWLLYGTGDMERAQDGEKSGEKASEGGATGSSANTAQTATAPLLGSGVQNHAPASSTVSSLQQKEVVKYIDKPQRKITEIRVFYDDQTWESFSPKH